MKSELLKSLINLLIYYLEANSLSVKYEWRICVIEIYDTSLQSMLTLRLFFEKALSFVLGFTCVLLVYMQSYI